MIKQQTDCPAGTYITPSMRVTEIRLPFNLMQSVIIPGIEEEQEDW